MHSGWDNHACMCMALTSRRAILPRPVSAVSERALVVWVREGRGYVPASLGSWEPDCWSGRPLPIPEAKPAVTRRLSGSFQRWPL